MECCSLLLVFPEYLAYLCFRSTHTYIFHLPCFPIREKLWEAFGLGPFCTDLEDQNHNVDRVHFLFN